MTAQRAIAANAAETRLGEQFHALSGASASMPRAAAFRRFEEAGLPTRRVEAWHYTDMRAALTSPAPPVGAPDDAAIEAARRQLAALPRLAATRLVVLDGHLIAALSDAPPAGVVITAAPPPVLAIDDPLLALNVALAQGGAAVSIAPGAEPKPIEIILVATKVDKVVAARRKPALAEVNRNAGARAIGFSAVTGEGREELWGRIRYACLGAPTAP